MKTTLEKFIEDIDFQLLKDQKSELNEFRATGKNYDTKRLGLAVQGILELIDTIQDIAVDEFGYDSEIVFDFNDGYDENSATCKEEKEEDEEKTFKRCQS